MKRNQITLSTLKVWPSDHSIEIDMSDLDKIGWIQITEIGEENVYFTATTTDNETVECFCKCL